MRQWICCFLLISTYPTLGYGENSKTTGKIKEAAFIIEKNKKHTLSQTPKLFFKAPTKEPTHKPLTLTDGLAYLPFHRKTVSYTPPEIMRTYRPPLHHCASVGLAASGLPYVDLLLHYTKKGNWKVNLAYIPESLRSKAKEGLFALQGSYGRDTCYLETAMRYHAAWYNPKKGPTDYYHQVLLQETITAPTQKGCIQYHLLTYHNHKLNEHWLVLPCYKWSKKWKPFSFQIKMYSDIARYTHDNASQVRSVFAAAPLFTITLPQAIQCKVGLKMAYHEHKKEKSNAIPNFTLYPHLKISHATTNWFNPYIGIGGLGHHLKRLHLQDIVGKNPLIGTDSILQHYHQNFHLHGGSKGKCAALSYLLHISYRKRQNVPRIVPVPDVNYTSHYKLLYHTANHNLLKVTALLYTPIHPKYHITIQGSYYHSFYEAKATLPLWWYDKPTYKLKPMITYRPHPKLSLTGNLHLQGESILKDEKGNQTKLKPKIDLSLKGNYACTPNWSTYIHLGNVLNQTYEHYTGYLGKKRNMTIGVQYIW